MCIRARFQELVLVWLHWGLDGNPALSDKSDFAYRCAVEFHGIPVKAGFVQIIAEFHDHTAGWVHVGVGIAGHGAGDGE